MEEVQAQDSSSTSSFPDGLPSNLQYPPNRDDKEDFQVTRDELDQIKQALKNEKFRKLLNEYAEEIQDPKSRTTYQDELRQLERQHGNIVHFINPAAGFVLKTSVNGDKKAFINVCSNKMIKKMSFQKASQDNVAGAMCSIPFAQSPVREDVDKAGRYCDVYDVVFHPNTLQLCKTNEKMQSQLEATALDAVEKSFNVTLDRNNVRRPKLKYKGLKHATMIKYKIGAPLPKVLDEEAIKSEPPPQPQEPYYYKKDNSHSQDSIDKKKEQEEEKSRSKSAKKDATHNDENENPKKKSANASIPIEWTEPKYSLKYRSHVDMQDFCFDNQREGRSTKPIPEEIILTVDLPMLKDSSSLEADVLEGGWDFELTAVRRAHYKLKLKLPFQVHCDKSKASFDVDKRKLTITMKTVQKVQTFESVFSSRSPIVSTSSSNSDSDNIHNNNSTSCNDNTSSSPLTNLVSEVPSPPVLSPRHENMHKGEVEETKERRKKLQHYKSNLQDDDTSAFSPIVESVDSLSSSSSSPSPSPVDDDEEEEEERQETDKKVHHENSKPLENAAGPSSDIKSDMKNEKYHRASVDEEEEVVASANDYKDMTVPNWINGQVVVKGILKRRSRSMSESWLHDDRSSYEEDFMSLESLYENEEEAGGAEHKSVRFNEAIQRQLYKRNSSILGQRKKNQRKSKNKRKARARLSSEGSSMEDEDVVSNFNKSSNEGACGDGPYRPVTANTETNAEAADADDDDDGFDEE